MTPPQVLRACVIVSACASVATSCSDRFETSGSADAPLATSAPADPATGGTAGSEDSGVSEPTSGGAVSEPVGGEGGSTITGTDDGGSGGYGGSDTSTESIDAGPPPSLCPSAESDIQGRVFFNVTAVTTRELQPYFQIQNDSNRAVDLADLELRYFFTTDTLGVPNFRCDYSATNAATGDYCTEGAIDFERIELNEPVEGEATHYIRVSWSSEEHIPVDGHVEVRMGYYEVFENSQLRVEMTQDNDYSFDSSASASTDVEFSDYQRITVYRRGELVSGQEPCNEDELNAIMSPP